MGTPQFGVPILGALVEDYEVVGVYTSPDRPAGRGLKVQFSPVKEFALKKGLPVFQPLSFKSREERERLRALSPDIIVVAGFGLLLPREVLDIPPYGCINVHPSLLPRHRGASPIATAILCGDEITGVSLMLMDEGLDTGPILHQAEIPILPEDTTGSLTVKLSYLGVDLIRKVLPKWIKGEIEPQKQDESRATLTRLIRKEEGEIDWGLTANDIWRRVRAFNPWPSCWTWWEGKRLKVLEAFPIEGSAEKGRVVGIGRGAGVGTGKGILGLKVVQLEGRKALNIEEFLMGARGFIGSLLPSHPQGGK